MNTQDEFAQPHSVDAVSMTFGGDVRKLMPKWEHCKDYDRGHHRGNKLFTDWFYSGITGVDGLIVRDGIDKSAALRHIRSIMSSWEPKHEHKTAACAYLFHKWFDMDASTWETKKRPVEA